MAYSFTNSRERTYYLHGKEVELKSGAQRTIYYFKKEVDPELALEDVPEGMVVSESRNGLPVLKKSE